MGDIIRIMKHTVALHPRHLLVLLACLALLSACTDTPSPVPPVEVTRVVTVVVTPDPGPSPEPSPVATVPPEGATLRTAIGVYPATLDPQRAESAEEQALLQLMYEGLVRLDEHLVPRPGAAQDWTISDDGKVLEFHLREGLAYANGTQLNAQRFVYALKRALNPLTAAPHGAWLDDIAGANAWRTADPAAKVEDLLKLESAVGISALDTSGQACQLPPDGYAQVDCRTLRLELERPSAALLTVLALPVAYPAPQESVEDAGTGANWWQNSRLQAGNGPFVLAHLEPYVRLAFVRNASYWRGSARLAGIDVLVLVSPEQALTLYRAGQLDVAPLSPADLAAVRGDRDLQAHVQVYPGACSVGYFFNLRLAPFDVIGVRRAVAQAIDRAAWAADIDQGLGWATESWIPPGLPGSGGDLQGWSFDPAAARDALDQAGYPGAAGLPEIKLSYPATARGKARTEFLNAQFRANLDLTARLDPLEPDDYTAAVEQQDTLPQFYRVGYCAPYPDPAEWLDPLFRSDATSAQLQGYANPDVDALLARAAAEYDVTARAELYRQAQQQVILDLPLVVMDNIANAYLVRPGVQGLAFTPQDSVLPGLYESLTIDVTQ